MADTPFIITTIIDNSQVAAQLGALSAQLSSFNPAATSARATAELNKQVTATTGLVDANGKAIKGQQKFGKVVRTNTNTMKRFGAQSQKTNNILSDVARRVFIWGSLSAAIFGALQTMKEFFDQTIQVNRAVAELKKVLPQESDFQALKEASFELSVEFGAEPLDVLQLLKRFGQAGLSSADAVSATNTALLALNTTGAETEQVFNAIIGANRIFGIAFENSGKIIDKVQRLQADFAIDAKDLIASIQGIGPAITVLGGDIDDLFANIAALGEAARVSGKEAANSLKRVFSRIVSTEGIQALQALGIQVFATADTFRPLRDVLNDLAKRMDTASDAEKQNIAVILAQVRQYSKFIALLNNFNRQQEALEKSINANGDAFKANLAVLDTYEKQLDIAKNKVRQFAEQVISSDVGLARQVTGLKSLLGDIFGGLGKIGGSEVAAGFIGVGAEVGLLTLAFAGVNRLLPKATERLAKTGVAAGRVRKTSKGMFSTFKRGNQTFVRFVPTALRIAAALRFIIPAALAAGIAYDLVSRKFRLRSKIIAEAGRALDRFKKALSGFDFAGIASKDVDKKFQSIINTLSGLKTSASSGKIPVDELSDAFSNLFFGTATENLTAQQLETLATRIEQVNVALTNSVLQPFFLELDSNIAKATTQWNKFLDNVVQDNELDSSLKSSEERFESLADALVKMTETLQGSGRGPVDLLGRLADGFLALFGSQSAQQRLAFTKSLGDIVTSIEDLTPAVLATIDAMVSLEIELEKVTDSTGKAKEGYKDLADELEGKLQKSAKGAAQDIFDLLDATRLFSAAASDANLVVDESAVSQDRANREARSLRRIMEELNEIVRKQGPAWLAAAGGADDFVKQAARLFTSTEQIEKVSEAVAGINAISFNATSYINAIKTSTSFAITSFNSQLQSILKIEEVSRRVGVAYSAQAEIVKSVEGAVRSLSQALAGNAKEINSLEIQLSALQAKAKAFEGRKDLIEVDAKRLIQANQLTSRIQTKLTALKGVQEENNRLFEEQLSTLERIRILATAAAEFDKRRLLSIAAQRDVAKQFLDAQVQLNKVKFGENIRRSSEENAKLFAKIRDLQLEFLELQAKEEKVSLSILETRKEKVRLDFEVAESQRKIELSLAESEKLYDRINSGVASVASTFENLLGDTNTWFEILDSRGSALEFLRRGLIGIGNALLQTDTAILAESIASRTRGLFDFDAEIQQLQKQAQPTGATLGIAAATEINASGQELRNFISAGFLEGTADFERVLATLPITVGEALKALNDQAAKNALDIIQKVKDLQEDTKDTQIGITDEAKELPAEIKTGFTDGASVAIEDIKSSMSVSGGILAEGLANERQLLESLEINVGEFPSQIELDAADKEFLGLVGDTQGANFVDSLVNANFGNIEASNFVSTLQALGFDIDAIAESIVARTAASAVAFAPGPGVFTPPDATGGEKPASESTARAQMKPLTSMSTFLKLGNAIAEEQRLQLISTFQENLAANREIGRQLVVLVGQGGAIPPPAGTGDGETARGLTAEQAALARFGGQFLGTTVGGALGGNTPEARANAQAGSALAGLVAGALGAGPIGVGLALLGGGLFGGLIGGGKEEEKVIAELESISRNTALLVDRLDANIFNAPSNFSLPSDAILGSGGIQIVNNFNITGGDSGSVVDTLTVQLDDLYRRTPTSRSTIVGQ